MSVISSMSTAISGLQAHGEALGVISDNITNANTTGFKASRGEFHSILAQDLLAHGSGVQIGRGTTLAGITNVFTQGPIIHSDRSTDLALNGNGFFVLNKDSLGMSFTRDGSFRFDKDGWLTTLKGNRVQAYTATPEGKVTGRLADVRLPFKTIPARATTEVTMHANLDARIPVGLPLDLLKPDDTAQFVTSAQIYDSIGNAHAITMYFNKIADSTWEWYGMTDGGNLLGGTPGQATAIAQGTLLFDQEGKLLNSDQNLVNTTFANGAISDQQLFFNFGDPLDKLGSGIDGTVQYGSKSVAFRNIQDGWGAGNLVETSIDSDGMVIGIYNNGVMKVLGQLGIARFEATERLSKYGENQFRETVESGRPLIGKPNTNGRGSVMAKSLEQSNVDLAKEFVDMIKIQRGFQASAKTITTSNELLDEVINIKRS